MNRIWNKTLIASLLLATSLYAVDIPIEEVKERTFSKKVSLNSKIVHPLSHWSWQRGVERLQNI